MFAGKTSTLIQRVSRLRSAGYRCLVVTHSIDTRYHNNNEGDIHNDYTDATSRSVWLSSHAYGLRYPTDVALSTLWELHQGELPSNVNNTNYHHHNKKNNSTENEDNETQEEKREDVSTNTELKANKTLLDWRNYSVIAIDEGQFFPDLYSFCSTVVAAGKHILVASLDGDCHQQSFGEVHRLLPLCESVQKLSAICMKCRTREAFFTQRRVEMPQQVVVGGVELYETVCRFCLDQPQKRGFTVSLKQEKEKQEEEEEKKE
ncbi:thymidine kinase [Trypanosoma theileri]|uniref:Thymidine kinase n=1 Tax=Trypanosoma theileri TaxID=67003 RepID=A0A1X0NMJ7_9TRYP|nr:thymidine kinase [Trypanosoma theileri]ORC85945.1 thymidine kinase [Trypanosoma theileri]